MVRFPKWKILGVDSIVVAWIWYSERKSSYYNSLFLISVKTWEGEVRLDIDENVFKIYKIIKMLKVALYCCLTSGILFIWL